MNASQELDRMKRECLCYFCSQPAKDSTETVNGKPDDHKVCPTCFQKNRASILNSRRMIAQFDAMF